MDTAGIPMWKAEASWKKHTQHDSPIVLADLVEINRPISAMAERGEAARGSIEVTESLVPRQFHQHGDQNFVNGLDEPEVDHRDI
ncbi:hypothetical protein LTR47_011696 [Exophiala xenobiotica]|nr:hypothetical protein LTR47_011696 [Exophiala xenobiotica]KAK5242979.1 hypothetical protein LTS06_011150 [Exophiala xenobiotica]KAK5310766.1 hypothetical protein LTR93_011944 [Exophiala xenobiotica]KAK5335282.1 hypothetical protein LTR43_012627 [Exophiala xenobiotica]KAK5356102.1 hypothetical protein LTR11_011687 [Exophiala xenobiotica]